MSQSMMRLRIAMQGFTIAAIVLGTSLGMKPHDRPKTFEERMERDQMTRDIESRN
jgi:hypothetical protein